MSYLMAHRGDSGNAPENTLASIKRAIEKGAKAIEIDVQLTKDGVPVLLHDLTVDRTTNGKGGISDLNYDEVRKLDAGSWFSEEFEGEKIPTLEEVFQLTDKQIEINIEIKNKKNIDNGIEKKVIELIHKYDMVQKAYITSFQLDVLKRAGKIDMMVRRGLIVSKRKPFLLCILKRNKLNFLSIKYKIVTKKLINNALKKGIKVVFWTVNKKTDIKRLKEMYPDAGICTNYPEKF